jgi:hypothetical protein
MKASLTLAAVLAAVAMSSPAFAQTGNDTETRTQLEQCHAIADPGLKAQCMERVRSSMGAGRHMQQMPQTPNQGQYRPGINSNLPPQDPRMNR